MACSSNRTRGFTLTEILVCLVIVATVWAITLPVFTAVKRSARRQECLSNLHQMGLAFNLYRDEQEGGVVGDRFQLGLPADEAIGTIVNPYKCNGELDVNAPYPPGYVFIVPKPEDSTLLPGWLNYSRQMNEKAVIMVDFRHNDLQHFLYQYYPKVGLGLTLEGQVLVRKRTGKAMSYGWWLDNAD